MNTPGGTVALKRYVMLVDQEGGPLARLIPRLRELDFRIVRVPEPTSAVEFVRVFLQIATGMHHVSRGQRSAAIERLAEGIKAIDRVTNDRGLDFPALRDRVAREITRLRQ